MGSNDTESTLWRKSSRKAQAGKALMLLAVAATGVLLSASPSQGSPIAPGDDLWVTPAGGSWDIHMIPAGTFTSAPNGEPSLAYDGPAILLMGSPLTSNNPAIPPTDTVVRRTMGTSGGFMCGAPPETVPIELVALSLVSINPITVNYPNDPPEQWNVTVCRAPGPPSTGGSMTLSHECPNGGSYTASLPVRAQLTFSRVVPAGVAGPVTVGPLTFASSGWWSHSDPGFFLTVAALGTMIADDCDGVMDTGISSTPGPDGFFPGLESVTCASCTVDGSFKKPMTAEEAMLAAHGVFVANRNKPEVVGACCVQDPAYPFGTCFMTGQGECQTQYSGFWIGAGTQCNPNPCFGGGVVCGDGTCDGAQGENPCTCPLDCGAPTASETGLCSDGIDNDCDGTIDCVDSPDCDTDLVCTCGDGSCTPPETLCNCPSDCGTPSTSETGLCTDGVDNDCDGAIDCADSDCASDPACSGVTCEPNDTGTGCLQNSCPAPQVCQPKCARLDPFTGQATVIDCDCSDPANCHLEGKFTGGAAVAGPGANGCVVPDNGGGTIYLPPPGCGYLSPDDVHMIIDGLPNTVPATTIQVAVEHKSFFCQICNGGPNAGLGCKTDADCFPGTCGAQNPVCSIPGGTPGGVVCDEPGGSLGGEKECSHSKLELDMNGTGDLAGFNKLVSLPVAFETHTAPRTPGDPVQSFDTDMFRLQGQLPPGDPDFDLLRIVAGTFNGMPSPGHTTLTSLPGGQWAVDSFFDITYRIDFVGTTTNSASPLFNMPGGSTTGTIRMATGASTSCKGTCPPKTVCKENRTVNADGTITVCCDCIPLPPDPHQTQQGTSLTFNTTDVPMIPANFFYPGSEPFMGTVNFMGGPEDTLIQRSATIVCPCAGLPPCPCDPIQTEIVALDLVSASPITVNPGGTQWDVSVGLSMSPTQPQGALSATKTHPNGGTFDAQIRVLPRITFTEVGSNPLNEKTIDYGLPPVRPPVEINFFGANWVVNLGPGLVGTIDAPNDGNFVPGVLQQTPGDPDSQLVVQATGESKGGGVSHPVGPVPLCPLPLGPNDPCAPFQSRDCRLTTAGQVCVPTVVQQIPGTVPQVVECGCRDENVCHIALNAAGEQYCVNKCPDPVDTCRLIGTDTDTDGVDDKFECLCDPPPPDPVCEPNSLGTGCNPITCPVGPTGLPEKCQPKCAILDPATGQMSLTDCDCVGENECHMLLSTGAGGADGGAAGVPGGGGIPPECVVPDNGSGTVTLPPAGCEYLSPDQFHQIINGLPAGVTIEIAAIHRDFICGGRGAQLGVCTPPVPGVDCVDEGGGTLGGDSECSESQLVLNMRGEMGATTAGPATFEAIKTMPVSFETHTAPRTPGDPVQSFDTDMFRLQGQLPPGDPDFDLLRIRAGTGFGMPSPGHTTLTQLPGGNWAVDSFFDIFYEIEFVGKPGGPLGGMSGSTTGTIRMSTKRYKCVGDCPTGTVCHESRTQVGGLEKICCECVPAVCEPNTDRSGCTSAGCDCFGECINGAYCDGPNPDCCLEPGNCLCYERNTQESIKRCPGCFGSCVGGSYCDGPDPTCWLNPAGAACYIANSKESILLCGDCFGECINGSYCDVPNPDCCVGGPTACQCYSPTHPVSIKLCAGADTCKPKCVKYNQATGLTTVESCDCVGSECYATFPFANVTAGPGGGACEVVDNGSGSVDLPPAGCDYLTADQVHKIIDGLPPGTEIHLAPIHKDFICHEGQGGVCSFQDVDCKEDGGSLGGEKECSDSTMEFQLTGTGTLAGWNRIVTIPNTSFETHIGKKKPFEPVQSFPTEMFRLFGQFSDIGDPDFDLLRITAGTDFGMPSPGHTTLTRLPNGNWAVDSFFDIEYRIDFIGTGPRLGSMSGSTTGTIRMQTKPPFKCTHSCPPGMQCVQTTTQPTPPDGTMTVCCDCVAAAACEPKPDRKSCTNNTCPKACSISGGPCTTIDDCPAGETCDPVICKPKTIQCSPPPPDGNGECLIETCDCNDGDICHVELPPVGATTPVCTGGCPGTTSCVLTDLGSNRYSCDCEGAPPPPVLWDPDPDSPARGTRSLRFLTSTPFSATATPGLSAIKVTMADLMHPNPRNLPQYAPPSYATFDTGTHGTCAGATTGPNFNGHHCSSDAECVGPNGAIATDDGTCTLPGPACTAVGEMNGCARWVGMPGTFYESQGPPLTGPYRASRLQCSPFYWDWASEPGGQVIVVGAEVLPSSEFSVEVYAASCKGVEDTCPDVSAPVLMSTRRKGDLDLPYQSPSPASLTQADVLDVAQAVASVKHVAGAPAHSRAQMQPNVPDLNTDPNVLDIVEAVDSVKRIAYSFSGPCVCPSTQTCGASCVGCAGLCLKSCVGGLNDGQTCNNNTHCPGVCSGGTNPGVVCPAGVPGGANCAGVCMGGSNPGAACTTPGSQCMGGGTCSSLGCSGTCSATGTCYDACGRCTP